MKSVFPAGEQPPRIMKLLARIREHNPLALWLPAFCLMQMIGISGAVVAAIVEIESIVGTGPVFSLLGLALAIRGRRSRSTAFFGLSAGVVSIAVFLLIYLRGWGPGDAQYPVSLILIGYEYLIAPVALLAAYRLRHGSSVRVPGRGLQFGLRHLLLLITFFAVVFASIRLAMSGHQLPVAVAPGLIVMLAVLVSWRLLPHQRSR